MASTTKLTFYTNRRCPWCRRVHAVLRELGTEVEEVIIDLNTPRPDWYLEINPKGQVPTLVHDGKIITESDTIAQYLVDRQPSHLAKLANEEGGKAQREAYLAFVSQFANLVQMPVMSVMFTGSEMTEEKSEKIFGDIATTLEPQLSSAKPFFGGSEKLTLVEALVGPFLSIIINLTTPDFKFPANWQSLLQQKAPAFYKWASATANHESISYTWNQEQVANAIRQKIKK
ncbi:hypothetical protein Cpir12675_002587 [Ceratocystis pirilliformis]|uniref:GST N-terminal domain-containing protein n=1 Tax=Ceratocystis pirilliformis TaxID=259994 RepID=A0ABR3ZAR3_9PEZI